MAASGRHCRSGRGRMADPRPADCPRVRGAREQMAGIMLLEDIRRIFIEDSSDQLFSKEMARKLSELEDRPWPEWHQATIAAPQIAKLLQPFGIRPGTIRRGADTAKGYKRKDFSDAFMRYLPNPSVTPSQVDEINDLQLDGGVTPASTVTDQIGRILMISGPCDGVTAIKRKVSHRPMRSRRRHRPLTHRR